LGLYVAEENLVYFTVGSVVVIQDRPHVVRAIRFADKGPQVAFEGVVDRAAAEEIRGSDVYTTWRRDLDEGEYWPEDLIGLKVITVDGQLLGEVVDVVLGAAQDRLVIGEHGIEIPLVKDLVPTVDLEEGRIVVQSLPGLTAPPH
jgi:16S rRNA processing protein RimM